MLGPRNDSGEIGANPAGNAKLDACQRRHQSNIHGEDPSLPPQGRELDALRKAAARSGRSVAELVRDAIRKVVLKPQAAGPVAIWDGEPKRASFEHDSVHDEP